MAIFLQIEDLSKSFGNRLLFSGITRGVFQGDKIGLIAPNGSGKTTFLNILAGKEDYDEGKLTFKKDIKIGFLEQNPVFDDKKTILENVISGIEEDGIEDKAKGLLDQLQIKNPERKIGNLSGGEVKRIAIAQVLLKNPDLLFLDEPTNHLDIELVEWLEKYLSKNNITLLMVTHDRYFLDKICNSIWEIDRGKLYAYEGNYSYYLEKREERYDAMNAELLRVKNLMRTELEWMRRQPQARGGKAKARIDRFYTLEEKSHENLNSQKVKLEKTGSYIGNKIFEAKNVNKSFGDKQIIKDWSYDFARHDKVGIVGKNGIGKTTFIKMLIGEEPTDSGNFDIGETVKWGYYSQEGILEVDEKKKVIDAMREVAEVVRIDEKTTVSVSQFLNRFLFSYEDQQKYIYRLSGGEKRRLNLALVLMKNPNFLILDEPTNDLDIMTLNVLEDYLVNFGGCVIIVSHDRFFLDRIANHLFVFEGEGVIKDFPGNYSNYRESMNSLNPNKKEKIERKDSKSSRSSDRIKNKTGLSYKEKKEFEELTDKLSELEKLKQKIENLLSSGTLTSEELLKESRRIQDIINEIDESEFRLLELMEKAEN